MRSATPKAFLLLVWPPPRSLATTCGISVDFFSSPYLDVSVQVVPLMHLWIQYMILWYCHSGLLHSDICGSMSACDSPQLFVAGHVLLRLLMPRHSPCALYSLTSTQVLLEYMTLIMFCYSNFNTIRFLTTAVISFTLTKLYLPI